MILGSIISGSLSDGIGRKMSQLVLIIPYAVGWIIMGFAINNTLMLIGRFITGVCRGAMRASGIVYIAESTDPKYRAVAFFYLCIAYHVGILISHTVGKYLNWKTSCFFFSLPLILAFVILACLKESPLWLLSKGRIDAGWESYRQFRGNGDSAEKELKTILEKTGVQTCALFRSKDTLKIIFSKPFMKSVAISFFLLVATQWCGVTTLSFYAQTIFEKTFSGDIDAFMLMVLNDSIRIAAAVFVCIFAKVLPRKITFVICCLVTGIILTCLVIYLYIAPVGLTGIAVACMVIYISAASVSASISWTFIAEIFPSKLRGFGSGLSSAISFALLFISVKVTPEIIKAFDEKVMYSLFAVITFFSGILLIFMLPNTGNRSLQDIEDSLYKKKDNIKKDDERYM